MAKTNHFSNSFKEIDNLLNKQASQEADQITVDVYGYAQCMANIENVIAVVSDLNKGTSRIFNGGFAATLGVGIYDKEDSIWEKKILSRMPENEREEKYIAELRFYHYLRHIGKSRQNYFLMSKLRFIDDNNKCIDVLHRMYYIFDNDIDTIRYAICVYGPLVIDFKGKSIVVNSINGISEELTSLSDNNILSIRERQVLTLINSGMKSKEIADVLNISIYTVSRHRQQILAKLQVKNSIEACRLAKSMELI